MKIQIPLSHSPIVVEDLAKVLKEFEGQPHEEIIKAFESKLCEITASPFAVALNSGTSALHLALSVLGVSTGDLVPVSTFTYVGSVSPIRYLGAHPVFIDSEEETWNMDPDLLEACLQELSSKGQLPKAILVVHSYGMPAKMDELTSISKKFEVPIVEDAAEALGATYKGRPAGSLGDIGVLSFNSNKTITSFGGGALLLKSKEQYDRVKFLAGHSRENLPYYEHHEIGYNYRMSPLNAAYGLSQLGSIDEKINQRRATFEYYKTHLQPLGFSFLDEPNGLFSSRWLSAILLKSGMDPLKIQAKLAMVGIETRPLWNPMHCQPAFIGEKTYLNGLAEGLFKAGLCLPSGGNFSKRILNKLISEIKI
ncbi:MAG: DegT/DnrJ/EryC1/StrS family aminotransferase [Cyclobacteriaceae bacterium]